ncbi:UDP-N-acetylmuramoyl-tripeptide--D-alanyl-D-alanine ligase [Dyadobacter sp. CECT 9623]|uniref:UDP-N-acetylmuramoyl-tripeptide--D-alanyl-D-alanine ligase n=1 Tax=Dyadobacter linearis TaxID=2823330 RepID=A0ABM8UR23_9BACT|nr:UDP-N-acetylmuramoyl-tripeptide--D-alanyl-D-alanine ligase [Dyadobacter sp. CECT 9623]CAG5069980.1 UDP-N-acetylmuramoyl-tripeptide--D-alanyl-D-alanine ligase [Dyadobacter sp. CECT 9623]
MFTTTETLYQHFKKSSRVSTDTRQVSEGCIFFALKGDKFDGNQYAAEALKKGAAYAVVSDETVVTDPRFLLVEDTLLALQDLARFHRKTFAFPVIALTGSNGKTTSKELIAKVLSMKYNTYATSGNLNNHIGVPLTLLAVDTAKNEMAVIEMGANHQQEIALLCSIALPTHGLITNIGKAHLEGFGGQEGVKKGKGELFDFLSKKKGIVFVNSQNDVIMEMVSKRRAFGEIVFYGSESSAVNPTLLSDNPVVTFQYAGKTVSTHLPGSYNFDNINAALAVGKHFGVEDADALEAVATYQPDNNRSQIVKKGSNTVIMDAYNANPSSMSAAIANFARLDAPRKMLILGDMFELGDAAADEHLALGKQIAGESFDIVILAGALMQHALPALPKAYYFPDKFSLHNWVMDNPQENTNILIKGSRGMSLETVLNLLPG